MKAKLIRAGELIVAGIFGYAGVLKALDPALFAQSIDHYRLLPSTLAAILALFLPWLELTASIALVLGKARRGALLVFLVLSLVFLFAVGSAWMRGLDIQCGCFGRESTSLAFAFFRNLALLGLLFVLCRSRLETAADPEAVLSHSGK